jgi:UDP-glucose-4-epimerase GalE
MKQKQNILVTGGAGYIGSHVCQALNDFGYIPVTYDNLSTGNIKAVKFGPFIEGDILHQNDLINAIEKYSPIAVIHMAASIAAGESVHKPGKYYYNNSFGGLNVIEAMVKTKIQNIVFSSTAAVYGNPITNKIAEDHPKNPINPYGASKLFVERMLSDFDISHKIKSVSLRYFNAAGADLTGQIGSFQQDPTNLIPVVMDVLSGKTSSMQVFGNDYNTEDGSCVRDYIHVVDLAAAHVKALEYLFNNQESLQVNLGTGTGYTVMQVIDMAQKISGKKLNYTHAARRAGDPEVLIADPGLANQKFAWQAQYSSLNQIVESAWNWQKILQGNDA